jgi:hypothetical protein
MWRTFVGVPLVHRDRLIGLLTISKDSRTPTRPPMSGWRPAIASHAAAAIENEPASIKDTRRAAGAGPPVQRLSVLTGITQRLLASTELEAVLQVVVRAAMDSSERRLRDRPDRRAGGDDRLRRNSVEPRAYFSAQQPRPASPPILNVRPPAGAGAVRGCRGRGLHRLAGTRPGSTMHAEAVAMQIRAFIIAPLLVDGVRSASCGCMTPPRVASIRRTSPWRRALADQTALAIEHARLLRVARTPLRWRAHAPGARPA